MARTVNGQDSRTRSGTNVLSNGVTARERPRRYPYESIGASAEKSEQVSSPAATKYHSKKTIVDNVTFDSKREAKRYMDLKIELKAGIISDLRLQPEYPFLINDVKIFSYFADFDYVSKVTTTVVIEDTKGFRTPIFRLKKKLIEAFYGIKITEV